jgi:hypothetical protein
MDTFKISTYYDVKPIKLTVNPLLIEFKKKIDKFKPKPLHYEFKDESQKFMDRTQRMQVKEIFNERIKKIIISWFDILHKNNREDFIKFEINANKIFNKKSLKNLNLDKNTKLNISFFGNSSGGSYTFTNYDTLLIQLDTGELTEWGTPIMKLIFQGDAFFHSKTMRKSIKTKHQFTNFINSYKFRNDIETFEEGKFMNRIVNDIYDTLNDYNLIKTKQDKRLINSILNKSELYFDYHLREEVYQNIRKDAIEHITKIKKKSFKIMYGAGGIVGISILFSSIISLIFILLYALKKNK